MATIKQILDALKPEERALLEYAFEHDIGQFVRLPEGKFIGVNITHMTYLKPIIETGKWRYGNDLSVRL